MHLMVMAITYLVAMDGSQWIGGAPTGTEVNQVSISKDGTVYSFVYESSPYMKTYKKSGDIFTRVAAPSVLPAGRSFDTTQVTF